MLFDCSYGKFKYILYRPLNVSNPPLIVILHGSGEIGNSLSKLKQREPYISLNKGTCVPKAIVLMPQLPKGTWGDHKASLKALIDHVAEENGCDSVSISGHSLGANGAMDMLLTYPHYFSAASVLSPCKDIGDKLKTLVHVPMWFLAGEKENNYKKYAQRMHSRLEELGGTTRLTLVPGYGHPIQFTWVSDKYQMFEWLTSWNRAEEYGMIADISKYQGTIGWKQLSEVLDFCIMRSSVGMKKDERYAEYVAGCRQYGVPYHAYHYIKATNEAEARTEAKVMAEATAGTSPLFYVIDAEYDGIKAADARKICEAFEDGLRHYIDADIRVAVYIGHHLYKSWALDYGRYAYVWIPRYGTNDGKPQTKPDYPCDLWQYTSKGKLPGISGNVDLNKLTGTKPLTFFTTTPDTPDVPDKQTDGGESQMFTGKQLAEFCENVYKAGWVYWYGTYGKRCSESLYNSKKKQYPSHYGSDRTSGYQKDIRDGKWCADCVGMIKAFFWKNGDLTAEPKYGSNNCPDKSANGMIKYCSKTGPISTIPDEPGLVVWKDGHIGVYVGGGYTVEMKGFNYDCKRKKVTDGPWTKWGRLPASMLQYTDEPVAPAPDGLKKGDYGSAVKEMQEALLRWDVNCLPKYGADGDFGSETEKAVKSFQKAVGLPQTGVYDEATRNALTASETPDKPDIDVQPQYVVVTGGSVNVRTAPGTIGTKVLGVVHKGDKLSYQAQDKDVDGTAWHLVEYKNQNAWISGKYSKVE